MKKEEKNSFYIVCNTCGILDRASERDKRKPMKPTKISVIKNPRIVNANVCSPGIAKKVEKRKIAVNSRVPNPAKVIGIKPAVFAIGNNNKKYT